MAQPVAILAQPPESVRRGIKITEQGEVVSNRYTNAAIAHRHLEQMINAVLLTSGKRPHYPQEHVWAVLMEELVNAPLPNISSADRASCLFELFS